MFAGHSNSLAAAAPPYSAAGATGSSLTNNSLAVFSGEQSSKSVSSSVNEGKQNIVPGCVFGPAPSRFEVENAIDELQRFMKGLQSTMLQAPGFIKLKDAFAMMQDEPAFQNMVKSIVCDKAVWEAILGNKAVQDLQRTIFPECISAKEKKLLNSTEDEEPDIYILIMRWIMGFTKSKILELVERFGQLVNEIFHSVPEKKPTSGRVDPLEEKIRSSLLLSVVILLIVVIARTQD